MKEQEWTGVCCRTDCSRTKPPIAYGKRWGECFVHEILGVYFQYEMAGQGGRWQEPDEIEEKREVWLQKLGADGVDLDAFAQEFAES